MELTEELKEMYVQTAEALRGSERRIFMAQVTKMLGTGGQRKAEAEMGWNRGTIRKGLREIEYGRIEDDFSSRGRKAAEFYLPNLLDDIRDLMSEQKLSAMRVRKRLISDKGYKDTELPSAETIRKKMKAVRAA